jgi:4-hydroxy-tetrahydrodipicolinate synthase
LPDSASDPARWEGIWGFPLTPFGRRGIDLGLLAAGAERQLAGGVDVLCACGVIAQVDRLTAAEHAACVRAVTGLVAGRVPVVATLVAARDAAGIAAAAAAAGADGLVVIPRSPRVDDAARSLRAVAAAAPEIPLALYHRPPLRLTVAQLRRLADEAPPLAWVKDGHRDVRLFRQLAAGAPRLRWVSAWEDVALAFWALGCSTFAPASTSYAPEYASTWLGRLRAGDLAGARELLAAHANPMVDLRLARTGIDIAVIKAAMEAAGIRAGATRPPAKRLTAAERARVRELVAALPGLLAG